MTRINRTDVVFMKIFLHFSARHIPVLNAKKQAKIQLLWCLNCFFEFTDTKYKLNLKRLFRLLKTEF